MRIVLIFLSLWLLTAVGHADTVQSGRFEYHFGPVPDWVQARAAALDSAVDSDQGVSYLLSDEQLDLRSGQQRYRRLVSRVNSEQGLTQASEFGLYFNPEYQALTLHHIRLWRDGQPLDVTRRADVRLMQQEEEIGNRLLTGEVTALVVLADVRVGDAIDYAYSVSGRNPVYGDKHFAAFSSAWQVSVQDAHVRLLVDAQRPLRHRQASSAQAPAPPAVRELVTGGHREYRWHQARTPAIFHEGDLPSWYEAYGYLEFSEYQNWREVAQWALSLYQDPAPLSEELRARSQRWWREARDAKDYVAKVLAFVQNDIRYFGLELGQNSHKPNHPNLVLERRYGDCKDKALLIASLLRERGIEAWSALVSAHTTGAVGDRLPSPGAFDHVISYFKLDGQDYWIDGTRRWQYGQLDELGVGDFQKALLVDPDSQSLVDVAPPDRHRAYAGIDERFEVPDFEAPVRLSVQLEYRGGEAEEMRNAISSQGLQAVTRNLLNYYKRQFPRVALVRDLEVQDQRTHNAVRVLAAFEIPDFWADQASRELPVYGENLSGYAQLPEVVNRKMPLGLYHAVAVDHSIQVALPDQLLLPLSDAPLVLENAGMRYQRDMRAAPGQVRVRHQYRSKRDHVPAAEVPGYLADLRSMREAIYISLRLPGDQASATERLRRRMRELLQAPDGR